MPDDMPAPATDSLSSFDQTVLHFAKADFGDTGEKGVALMESGTIAAHTPIVVPVTRRVNGRSATRSTIKGVARKPLITAPSTRLARGAWISPPGEDKTRNTASGIPAKSATNADTPTIANVSRKACQRRLYICGVITDYPCCMGQIAVGNKLFRVSARRRSDDQPSADMTLNAVQIALDDPCALSKNSKKTAQLRLQTAGPV